MICPASGPSAPPQPDRCDDTAYGKGAGGGCRTTSRCPPAGTTVWFAVAGLRPGRRRGAGRAGRGAAATRPGCCAPSSRTRRAVGAAHPGRAARRPAARSAASPGASRTSPSPCRRPATSRSASPTPARTTRRPQGTVAKARWIGAGWPDYPWLFATDGEYTGFAAVAARPVRRDQGPPARAARRQRGGQRHQRQGRPRGDARTARSTSARTATPGNTDETAKFPSTVALVWRWTGDDAFRDEMYAFSVREHAVHLPRARRRQATAGPRVSATSSARAWARRSSTTPSTRSAGCATSPTWRASKGDTATARLGDRQGRRPWRRASTPPGGSAPTAQQYADSLDDPGNKQVFQRHWIGVTPVEAEITRPGRPAGPLAPTRPRAGAGEEARDGLLHRAATACSTPAPGRPSPTDGNSGATCDTATSSVKAERAVFTLNTAIMAVAEAALGRMAPSAAAALHDRQRAGAARPEGVGAARRDAGDRRPRRTSARNIDKQFTERSMALQAWGAYGILWPVVHYQLGVSPDVGRDRFTVVPQIPSGQYKVARPRHPDRHRAGQRHRAARQRPAGDDRPAGPARPAHHRRAAAHRQARQGGHGSTAARRRTACCPPPAAARSGSTVVGGRRTDLVVTLR